MLKNGDKMSETVALVVVVLYSSRTLSILFLPTEVENFPATGVLKIEGLIGCVWVWSEGIALSCSPPMFPFCSGASSGSMVPATYYSTSVAISLFSSLALVFYYVV